MKSNNIKKTIVTSAFGLVALLGMSEMATAQSRNPTGNYPPQVYNQRIEQQRIEAEKQRQRDEQVRLEQQRQEHLRIQNQQNQNIYTKNVRYKVYQNGKFFVTDARGLEMLKQAVIRGYEQGFQNGQFDRRNKRRGDHNNNSAIYQNGNYGYQNSGGSQQYQYYFQKGFAEGHQDGFNSRKQRGWNRDDVKITNNDLRAILKFERF